MLRSRPQSLLAFAFALLSATVVVAQEEAIEQFRQAEEAVARKDYGLARRMYATLARKWAGTPTGELCAERAEGSAFLGTRALVENGPSANRVDVVIMGDSFQLDELGRFDAWAEDIPKLFETRDVFEEYADYHNFRVATLVSADGDVDAYGREYDTMLGARIMGNDSPWVVVDNARVQQVLRQVPDNDGYALVLVKAKGFHGTGGGQVGTVSGPQPETIMHEWGHAFGDLGDEYTTYTHPRGDVRSRPNISNVEDPRRVPWAHWIERNARGVGVYRGGAGRLKGAWRPEASGCLMQDGRQYCRVCREALVLRIYELVDPIDACEPGAMPSSSVASLPLNEDREWRFHIDLVTPKKHGHDVAFYVLPELSVPRAPRNEERTENRKDRGRLEPIAAKPVAEYRNVRARSVEYVWRPEKELSGRFRIVVRVVDPTPSDRGLPWVLKDEHGLLESERGWWIDLQAGG
jgi:hypothetical protein